MDENIYSFSNVNLTSSITAQKLQQIIEGKLNRTTKKKLRPLNGKKMVMFIDDLHYPIGDQFEYQPPLELLR